MVLKQFLGEHLNVHVSMQDITFVIHYHSLFHLFKNTDIDNLLFHIVQAYTIAYRNAQYQMHLTV